MVDDKREYTIYDEGFVEGYRRGYMDGHNDLRNTLIGFIYDGAGRRNPEEEPIYGRDECTRHG